jgi:hypothetical protein
MKIIQSLYYAPAGRYIPAKVPIEGAVLFKLGKYMQVLSISHKMADYFAFPLLFY